MHGWQANKRHIYVWLLKIGLCPKNKSHPLGGWIFTDICDMYAKADMYGLGAGIYPKDKLPPLPVHPHCLCRYVEVIEGEVDMQQQRDQAREAGDKWLNSLPE